MIALAIIATVAFVWLLLTLWAWTGTDDIAEAAFVGIVITLVLAVIGAGAYGLYSLWEVALS